MARSSDQHILIATGHHNGTISLRDLTDEPHGPGIRERWKRPIHDGRVTTLSFVGEDYLASGGLDKAVCLSPIEAGSDQEHDIRRLHLSIRCSGIIYTDVRGPNEQARLSELSTTNS